MASKDVVSKISSVINHRKKEKISALFIISLLLMVGSIGTINSFSYRVNADEMSKNVWPSFGCDRKNTGRCDYKSNIETPKVRWRFTSISRSQISTSSVIDEDGTIYVGSGEGLYAVNPDGTLKWHLSEPGSIRSSPSIAEDGTIYVGSWEDGNLYAIKPDDTLKWHFSTGESILSSPAVGEEGTIYVGSKDGNLYAINPDGTLKWNYSTDGPILSSPAVGEDGTIYVGSKDGYLYAVNPNGALKWNYSTDGPILSSPAVGEDGTIYVGSKDGKLYAINSDGTLMWNFSTDSRICSSPSVADNNIYFGTTFGRLYSVNSNGQKRWSSVLKEGENVSAASIGSSETIYVASYEGSLYAINTDGKEKWSYSLAGWVTSSPVIGSDGTVYLGAWDGNLYAFEEAENPLPSPIWLFSGLATIIGSILILYLYKKGKLRFLSERSKSSSKEKSDIKPSKQKRSYHISQHEEDKDFLGGTVRIYKIICILSICLIIIGAFAHYTPKALDMTLEKEDRSELIGDQKKNTLAGNVSLLGIILIMAGFFLLVPGTFGMLEEKQQEGKEKVTSPEGKISILAGALGVLLLLPAPYISIVLGLIGLGTGFKAVKEKDNKYGRGGIIIGILNVVIAIYLFFILG